jgi:N-acetylglucosaminyl-diphospho-decaprenol L-rhamnosyltransferase
MTGTDPPTLSVIIVNWNTRDLLRESLDSLSIYRPEGPLEVIVVDNGSSDGSTAMVTKEFPSVRLIRNRTNEGFAKASNRGIRASRGEYVLLLNSDAFVGEGALDGLITFMEGAPDCAIVGPRLVNPDGTVQPYIFGDDPTLSYLVKRYCTRVLRKRALHRWESLYVQEVGWVTGAAMMVRRNAMAMAGLLDEKMFMYFEDCEWCLRMRQAGWKVFYHPAFTVTHLGGQSLSHRRDARLMYFRSLRYFYRKHYGTARWLLVAALTFPFLVRGGKSS